MLRIHPSGFSNSTVFNGNKLIGQQICMRFGQQCAVGNQKFFSHNAIRFKNGGRFWLEPVIMSNRRFSHYNLPETGNYMHNEFKYKGEKHRGPDHRSPYPVSRQAPSIDLVELAKEVAEADDLLTIQAVGKLRILAQQIEQLRKKAQEILAETKRDQQLHRVRCGFKKRPGGIYYLYSRKDNSLLFSIISPDEWNRSLTAAGLTFKGSYRLEGDRSWTPLDSGDNGAAGL